MRPGILYVDSRTGSRELRPYLSAHGIRVELKTLNSADFAFLGHERDRIGVERKTVPDLTSSLTSNRLFGEQIPKLVKDYRRVYLVAEGLWRPGRDDAIEVYRRGEWGPSFSRLTYSQLSSWLVRYDEIGQGKLLRWRTSSPTETAAFVASLYRWWQKPWDKHEWGPVAKWSGSIGRVMVRKPTQMMVTVHSLPEIGGRTMLKACRYFSSIHEAMNASEAGWRRAGLGKADARKVWGAIRKKYR